MYYVVFGSLTSVGEQDWDGPSWINATKVGAVVVAPIDCHECEL